MSSTPSRLSYSASGHQFQGSKTTDHQRQAPKRRATTMRKALRQLVVEWITIRFPLKTKKTRNP